jgi:hypothetical protein
MRRLMWRLVPALALAAGCYIKEEPPPPTIPEPPPSATFIDTTRDYTIVAGTSDKCLQMVDRSMDDAALAELRKCDGSDAQRFRFIPIAGAYNIRNVPSGKCIDVRGAVTDEGADVLQFVCHAGDNEQWIVSDTNNPGFVRLVDRHSLKVADVWDGKLVDGALLKQRTWNQAASEQFKLRPVVVVPPPPAQATGPGLAATEAVAPGKRIRRTAPPESSRARSQTAPR